MPKQCLKLEKISQQPGIPVLSVRYSVLSSTLNQWIPCSIKLAKPIDVNDHEWTSVIKQLIDFQVEYPEAVEIKNNLRKLVIETLAGE